MRFQVITDTSNRRYDLDWLRVLAILLVNASWAASMELLLKAFFFDITIELGIYLPLLAMNSFLILSLQNTALLNDPLASLRTNLRQGTFVVMIICCVGLTRELLTHGALFTDAEFLSLIDIPTIEFYHRGLEILRSPFAVFFLLGLAYPLIVKLSGIMDVFRT